MKVRLVLAILLSVGLLAVPVLARDITVGDFALKYANTLNMRVSTPSDAVRALVGKGLIRSDVNLSSPLTEGLLVEIFGKAGINASTNNATSNVSDDAAANALSALSTSMNNGSSNDPQQPAGDQNGDDDANNNGKKTRPHGQAPNSRANPNAFYGREDEG